MVAVLKRGLSSSTSERNWYKQTTIFGAKVDAGTFPPSRLAPLALFYTLHVPDTGPHDTQNGLVSTRVALVLDMDVSRTIYCRFL